MERLNTLLNSGAIPFLMTAGVTPKLSTTRIVEAVVIAALAAGANYAVMVVSLQKDIEYTQKTVQEIREGQKVHKLEFNALQQYSYTHRHEGKL